MLSGAGKFFDQLPEFLRALLCERIGFPLHFPLFSLFFQTLTDQLRRVLAMFLRHLARRWLAVKVIADGGLLHGFQVA